MEDKKIVFLDFNGKLLADIFDRDVFIRIENLHKKNPLVQVNDTIFSGSYDYAMGTNLFYEENEKAPKQTDVFIKKGPIQFDNVFNSNKVINLKQVQAPVRKVQVPKDPEKIEFNLDWNYETLLKKFSEGSLQIQDMIKSEIKEDTIIAKKIPEVEESMEMDIQETDNSTNIDKEENISEAVMDNTEEEIIVNEFAHKKLLEDYQKLKQLAFRPVKITTKQELTQECDPKYKEAYEYHNLECQVIQPCDFFRSEPIIEINEETFSNCVDIDRCILYGILEKSTTHPRILTSNEKRKVLTLNNFDNLSLAGRYYVLKNHVQDLEEYLETRTKDELNTRDAYGRLPEQTLNIYKKLTEAVKKRLEEIKYSLKDKNDEESHQAGSSKENE